MGSSEADGAGNGGGASGTDGRKRRVPTIELTATEVPPEPEAREAAASAEPAGQPATPAGDKASPQSEAGSVEPETPAPDPPPPDTAKADEPAPATPRRALSRSPWLAAAAGAAIVLVLFVGLWLGGALRGANGDAAAVNARLALIELQLRDLTERRPVDPKAVADLGDRLAKVETEAKSRNGSVDAAVGKRLSDLEAGNKSAATQAERLATLAAKVDDNAQAARAAQTRANALASTVTELNDSVGRIRAARIERSDLDKLAARIAAVESTAKALQDEMAKRAAAGAKDHAVRLAVAAEALKNAVERGAPFAAELDTVKPLAADPGVLAPLTPFAADGLPSVETLARALTALVPQLESAAAPVSSKGGFLEKLQSNAEKLVRVRPLSEATGDDPASQVARVAARADKADIDGALAALAALPADRRAPAADWIARAQARQRALAAARGFAARALTALRDAPQ